MYIDVQLISGRPRVLYDGSSTLILSELVCSNRSYINSCTA